jgi:two-component system KDP operon response regulator KdpE
MSVVPDFTVLVIDSDAAGFAPVIVPALLVGALRVVGGEVLGAASGAEGLRLLYDAEPDVIVLPVDAGEPGAFPTLARVRDLTSLPVLMVGTTPGPAEDSRAMAAGADDYVAAPIGDDELAARVKRLAERARRDRERYRTFRDGGLQIDFTAVEVSLDGVPIRLTRLEYRLLAALVERSGQVIATERLLELVWDEPIFDRGRVKAHVAALRRKLGRASGRIETLRGSGYRYRRAERG